jgi:hypothetical protein
MSEATHFPGGVLSVHANDDGLVECLVCGRGLRPDDVWMLMKWPHERSWIGFCQSDSLNIMESALVGIDRELDDSTR